MKKQTLEFEVQEDEESELKGSEFLEIKQNPEAEIGSRAQTKP